MSPDPILVDRLKKHGQSQLLRWWGELDEEEQGRLASEIRSIDFERLDRLIADLVVTENTAVPPVDRVQPIDVVRLPQTDGERVVRRRAGGMGADALAAGEVGVILARGGSGTRLGYEGPKGTFPIGPVSSASLFQIHAEKVAALVARYGRPIPLYIMTSPENHEATIAFFESHGRFGLEHVRFFTQGQMPAVDRATSKVLRVARPRAALAPDGHGGTLTALAMRLGPVARRVALTKCATAACARFSIFRWTIRWSGLPNRLSSACLGKRRRGCHSKVVEWTSPEEKLGVVVTVDGRPR